jgi:hypothetical protein
MQRKFDMQQSLKKNEPPPTSRDDTETGNPPERPDDDETRDSSEFEDSAMPLRDRDSLKGAEPRRKKNDQKKKK